MRPFLPIIGYLTMLGSLIFMDVPCPTSPCCSDTCSGQQEMHSEKDKSVQYTEDDVTNNMGLVFTMAKRMKHLTKRATTDFEDLISDGVLGLIHALDRFDPDKGHKFSTYACRCIYGYMLRGHRIVNQETWKALQSKYEVPCNTISMYTPALDGPRDEMGEVLGVDDCSKSAHTMFDIVNNRSVWESLLPILTARQRQMVVLSMQDMTQVEIAEQLGVTRQCVSQTMQLVIKKAKRFFAVKEAA